MINSKSHRKTVSNNNPILQRHPTQLQIKKQNYVNSNNTQQLINRLASLQVLKNLVFLPSTQKLRVDQQKKRIKTEGNDKQSFHNGKMNSQDRKSVSPKLPRQDLAYLKSLLLTKRQASHSQNKRTREQRNQSADFQYLLKNNEEKYNNRKKHHYNGSLNEHIPVSQRFALSECSSALELLQKQNEELRPSHSTKLLNRHWITTKQFKEKLSSLSKEKRTETQQINTNQTDDIIKTHKKENYKYANMRGRTDTEQPPIRSNLIGDMEDIGSSSAQCIKNKRLESKIDLLVQQVSILNKKSEQLEQQNKVLFDNLSKIFQLI